MTLEHCPQCGRLCNTVVNGPRCPVCQQETLDAETKHIQAIAKSRNE